MGWAYRGRLTSPKGTRDVVLKRFIGSDVHSKSRYLKTLEEAAIASFLAQNYNAQKAAGRRSIRFVEAAVLEMDLDGSPEFFTAEAELPREPFLKFCNNAGDWDEEHMDLSLLEFSKYTHDATDGFMMVTDLQGVRTETEFVLTDPAVNCRDLARFMETNVGE